MQQKQSLMYSQNSKPFQQLRLHCRAQLVFATSIPQTRGSNLGGYANYLATVIAFTVPEGKCGENVLNQATAASFHFIIDCHPIAQRCVA